MQHLIIIIIGDLDDYAGVGGSERTTIVAINFSRRTANCNTQYFNVSLLVHFGDTCAVVKSLTREYRKNIPKFNFLGGVLF